MMPIPAAAFYTTAHSAASGSTTAGMFQYPGHVFQPGFQQSHADFQAWTNAYQHMAMAANNAAQGRMIPPAASSSSSSRVQSPVEPEYERRRTISGPAKAGSGSFADAGVPSLSVQGCAGRDSPSGSKNQYQAPQPFHPYKRAPGHKPSRESLREGSPVVNAIPRSVSTPSSLGRQVLARDELQIDGSSRPSDGLRPSAQAEAREPALAHVAQPRVVSAPSSAPSTPAKASAAKVPTPLQPGPITMAMNAQPSPRKSSLGQGAAASPEGTEKKSFKSRFRIGKSSTPPTVTSTAPAAASTPSAASRGAATKTYTSPSETSTRSGTPPVTPPAPRGPQELRAPNAPFVTYHNAAMHSEVSLAGTEATMTGETIATEADGGRKGRKGLFRLRNMSTDNISISSTVSSASMMIRKMGSIGKLAKRNRRVMLNK